TSPMSVGSWILGFSSAASSAAAFLNAIGRLRRVSDVARTASAVSGAPLAVGGALAENALMLAMEKRLGLVGEPYKQGESGRYNKVAKACTLAGAALLAGPGRRSRFAAAAGGTIVLAGEVA